MTYLPHRAAARKGIKPPADHSSAANGAQPSRNHPSSEPFLVNGRIKICAGCKGPHLKIINTFYYMLGNSNSIIFSEESFNFVIVLKYCDHEM